MSTTCANGRSIVHQGDGQTNTCAAPDVCKTPSPGGPVPVPYVNIARDSDLAQGSKTVEIEGHPVAIKGSYLSTSTGDEPGTAGGGIISSKTKGKMTWGSFSLDVKYEGKGVVRYLDTTRHNGNTFNTAFIQQGGTGLAYGDDPVEGNVKCPNCKKDKSEHRLLETHLALGQARNLMRELLMIMRKRRTQDPQILKMDQDEYGNTVWRGYMIGALVCKCNQRIYAAMSGGYYLAGFKAAVENLRSRDGRWMICSPLTSSQPIKNPRGDLIALSSFQTRKIGKNRPGQCAGPQLIQKALSEGHIPASLSEIWFWPRMLRRFQQGRSTVTVKHFRNGEEQVVDFHHRQSVPSCDTCKVLMTEMLCDVNTKEC